MRRRVLTIAAIGLLGSVAFGLGPLGCGSRLEPVRASQNGGIDHPNLPDITVEHAKDCVAEYGSQLPPGYHVLNSSVLVDENGDKKDVTINDISNTAPDFGACMRKALADMPIAEEPFRQGVATLKLQREQASAAQRSLVSNPVVIVVAGVVIVVSELVLEAGAYTIMFAVTVKVVEKAKDDVAELVKRKRDRAWDECLNRYEACVAGKLYREQGKDIGDSRCGLCVGICRSTGKWPTFVDLGPCI